MRKQQGLSLIELMISITIGLILMTGVVQLFLSSKTTFATQQAMSRIQETGRLAIDFMARDIRMAGYMGCVSRGTTNIINGLETTTDYLFDFSVPLVGYTSGGTTQASDPIGGVAEKNTDYLIVRRAGSESMPIIADTNHGGGMNANIDVSVAGADQTCAGNLCDNDTAIISDCAQGRIFRVNGIGSIGNGDDVRINHSNGKKVKPSNIDNNLGGQQFGAGAEVIKLSTIAFFISDSGVTGEPALWQRIDDEAYELLEGVEDMSLTYGTNGNYAVAASVTDWDAVDSVRIELLVRSIEDNVIPDPQPYTFEAAVVSDPGDRRMRQVFSSTVAIRNRLQ